MPLGDEMMPHQSGEVRTGYIVGLLTAIVLGMSAALWAVVTDKADKGVVQQIDARLERMEDKLDRLMSAGHRETGPP